MLKIAVCVKQIPLIEDANFDPVTKTIKRDGVNVISAYDLRAIAQAVELKRELGAETTVVTMGPPQAREALIDALGMGIDRAAHLEDRAFAGSDTLATARTLAHWLGREQFDLIMLGKYSLDAETGQVGPEIAELLGIAQITGVRRLKIEGWTLLADRESDEGHDEVECALPALLTCAERLIDPIKKFKRPEETELSERLTVLRLADLELDKEQCGFAGSPTWVQGVRPQEAPQVECRMIDAADAERAVEQLITELEESGALHPRERQRPAIADAIRQAVPDRDVWVVVETGSDGAVTLGTLELLSAAHELAKETGGALFAVGLSGSIAAHAGLLASYGADELLIATGNLAPYSSDTTASAMARLVSARRPWGLFLNASERGRDWGPRLAARLGVGLTGDAVGLERDTEGRLIALKPAFGGNIVAPILSKTLPQMATVRQGVLELAEPNPARTPRVSRIQVEVAKPLTRLLKENSNLDHTITPLEGAEVVVGVGMGVGGPDGVAKAKEFAQVLGAGMCATRRVTDKGWMPHQLQVGLTGKAIAPRLYFTLGIRGVPNHTVGIKRAETVVAVNNDPEAVIFERANFGLVGDFAPLTEALIAAFRRRHSV